MKCNVKLEAIYSPTCKKCGGKGRLANRHQHWPYTRAVNQSLRAADRRGPHAE